MNWIRRQASLMRQRYLVRKAEKAAYQTALEWAALHGDDYDYDSVGSLR